MTKMMTTFELGRVRVLVRFAYLLALAVEDI